MVEITKIKDEYGHYIFNIKTEEGIFSISFQNNLDLYWNYIYKGNILSKEDKHIFYITKENYYLYYLFDKLYKSVKNQFPLGKTKKEEIPWEKNDDPEKLFKDNKIIWHSDDDVYEYASTLIIEPEDERYKITFRKSKESNYHYPNLNYQIRITNSGSRYNPYNIPFMKMYNSLVKYEPEYHQTHIEEEIYKQKILQKRINK